MKHVKMNDRAGKSPRGLLTPLLTTLVLALAVPAIAYSDTGNTAFGDPKNHGPDGQGEFGYQNSADSGQNGPGDPGQYGPGDPGQYGPGDLVMVNTVRVTLVNTVRVTLVNTVRMIPAIMAREVPAPTVQMMDVNCMAAGLATALPPVMPGG